MSKICKGFQSNFQEIVDNLNELIELNEENIKIYDEVLSFLKRLGEDKE